MERSRTKTRFFHLKLKVDSDVLVSLIAGRVAGLYRIPLTECPWRRSLTADSVYSENRCSPHRAAKPLHVLFTAMSSEEVRSPWNGPTLLSFHCREFVEPQSASAWCSSIYCHLDKESLLRLFSGLLMKVSTNLTNKPLNINRPGGLWESGYTRTS